ncbi:MBL fold metallo-hydrolase [Slackia heliotrinireducens]|uniref:MBL fold metallo-hydrolase n=1 Tax=Slackia heliotrinireducens TaxID=84110 RepID=UPI003314BCF7
MHDPGIICKRNVTNDYGRVSVTMLTIGPMNNLTYIVSDGHQESAPCVLIDPAGDPDAIIDAIGWYSCQAIVLTHGHADHVLALPEVAEETGAPVIIHRSEADVIERGQEQLFNPRNHIDPVKVARRVQDGDVISVGSMDFKVIHTPGHTRGGICLYLELSKDGRGLLFSGDTLFCGATGRTDLEGGSDKQMRQSMRTKLAPLPDITVVYPGHDSTTTIGAERRRTIMAF